MSAAVVPRTLVAALLLLWAGCGTSSSTHPSDGSEPPGDAAVGTVDLSAPIGEPDLGGMDAPINLDDLAVVDAASPSDGSAATGDGPAATDGPGAEDAPPPPPVVPTALATPISGTRIGPQATLVIDFSVAMQPLSLGLSDALASEAGTPVWSNGNQRVTLAPASSWSDGNGRALQVTAQNLAGTPLSPLLLRYDVDAVAPTGTPTPSSGSSLPASHSIVIVFSESMLPGSLGLGGSLSGSANVAWSTGSHANDTLTLTGPWPVGTGQTLTVAATDLVGNAGNLSLTYNVLAAPTVLSTVPTSGSPIAASTQIVVTFSRSMLPGTLLLGGALGSSASAAWSNGSATNDTLTLSGTWPLGTSKNLTVDVQDFTNVAISTLSLSYDVLGAPTISNVTPAGGATIGPQQKITVTFSQAMSTNTLSLGGEIGGVAASSWTSASSVDITPTASWPGSSSGTDFKTLQIFVSNIVGVALTPVTLSYIVDATAPSVSSTNPTGGSTIGPHQAITVHFSESVDPSTFTGLDGTLSGQVGTTVFSQTTTANDTLTITPLAGGWPNGAGQTLIFRTEVKDLYGNVMSGPTLMFPVDALGPTLSSATPVDGGLLDWAGSIDVLFNENLSPTVSDHTIGGTLTTAAPFTATIVGNKTLHLVPNPHWVNGDGRTLTLTVVDVFGNASAPLTITYNVVDGAVYVHPGPAGNDANPGTRTSPKATITAGLTAADALYVTGEVHVAAGTYTGAITIPSGITLFGGYNPADWTTPPNRVTYQTIINDASGGATPFNAVTMVLNTRLERFYVQSRGGGVTGNCKAVFPNASGAGTITIQDNDIEGRDCTLSSSGIGGSPNVTTLTINNNSIRTVGASNTTAGISLSFLVSSAQTLNVTNNDVRASTTGAIGTSYGADFLGGTVSGATILLDGNFFRGGIGNNSYGAQVNVAGLSCEIRNNRLHGGTANNNTYGLDLNLISASGTVHSNAIYGGEPQVDNMDAHGLQLGIGNYSIYNNLISGGGRVAAGTITQGDCWGILTSSATNSAKIFNNTIHHGYLSRRGAIGVAVNGPVIRNNILLLVGFLVPANTNRFAAIQEEGIVSSTSPAEIKNNLVYLDPTALSSGHGFVYEDAVASGGTGCTGSVTTSNCYTTVTPLNTASESTGGGASTASGNLVGDPSLAQASWPTSTLPALVDTNGNVQGNWQITAASIAKTAGLDGGPSALNFGFTDDYDGGPARTGNGTTGWSIGAYEQDN